MILVSAVVWAHSGGESVEMASDMSLHSHHLAMAFCLAVLEAGASLLAVGAVLALTRRPRAPRTIVIPRAADWQLPRALPALYARAGPAGTQVFLR